MVRSIAGGGVGVEAGGGVELESGRIKSRWRRRTINRLLLRELVTKVANSVENKAAVEDWMVA